MAYEEYMGMLQPTAQDRNEALTYGLLGLGSGLLQGSTGHYGQFAPALGAGLQSGMVNYQNALQQSRGNRLNDIQLALKFEEMKRKKQEEKQPAMHYDAARGAWVAAPTTDNPMGSVIPLQGLPEIQARPEPEPKAAVGYIDPISGKAIWGTIKEAKGKQMAVMAPDLQGTLAASKERGKTLAEETAKAELDVPRVIQNANTAITLSDELLKHPGFGQAVGKSAMFGSQKIPGTQGYDFMNRLAQIKGGAFLEAFNTLKGGGQITEVEGKKATDAIARMDNLTSEDEFKQAVKDFQDVIKKGVERAKVKAGMNFTPNTGQWGIKRVK